MHDIVTAVTLLYASLDEGRGKPHRFLEDSPEWLASLQIVSMARSDLEVFKGINEMEGFWEFMPFPQDKRVDQEPNPL
jgi:hypothetical protein